jgi:hypothetical protein
VRWYGDNLQNPSFLHVCRLCCYNLRILDEKVRTNEHERLKSIQERKLGNIDIHFYFNKIGIKRKFEE